jgi:hypothetical protein
VSDGSQKLGPGEGDSVDLGGFGARFMIGGDQTDARFSLVEHPLAHAFWNAGDEPARLLELISPSGFESYFADLGEVFAAGPPDPEKLGAVAAKYDLAVDPESIPRLAQEHGLQLPGPPPAD